MRYYGATVITGPEAAFLIERNLGVPGQASVISFEGTWYDVRALNAKELESFMDQLARTGVRSRIMLPH
jgi:hypothetical protein